MIMIHNVIHKSYQLFNNNQLLLNLSFDSNQVSLVSSAARPLVPSTPFRVLTRFVGVHTCALHTRGRSGFLRLSAKASLE